MGKETELKADRMESRAQYTPPEHTVLPAHMRGDKVIEGCVQQKV
jgi:hypothetical protein